MQRKKSLLPEHELRHHRGTFLDRRFGESDPSMSMEDRMLERYTRERQAGQGRKGMFNLEDDDGDVFGDLDEGFALGGGLTHGGRSVDQLKGDDFDAQGLGLGDREAEDEDEDVRMGRIGRGVVRNVHFGGGEGDEDEGDVDGEGQGEERKKSKQEVMAEVIAKSKAHKLERQLQNERDAEAREELDADIDDIRALLDASASANAGPSRPPIPGFATGANASSVFGAAAQRDAAADDAYDKFVRSIQFDARARPKDRTKTEDELALEEKERLESAERKRLKRMRGEADSEEEDDDDEGGRARRKGKQGQERAPEGDDLGGDWEEELLGPGLTREGLESVALPMKDGEEDDDDDDEDSENNEDGNGEGEDEDNDEDNEEGEDDEEDEDEDEDDDEDDDEVDDLEDLQDDVDGVGASDDDIEVSVSVVKPSKGKARAVPATKEIPYTFSCPSSIEEFEDLLDGLADEALPTVVQRIRSLHHPSLAQGNKEKLQVCFHSPCTIETC